MFFDPVYTSTEAFLGGFYIGMYAFSSVSARA